MGGLNRDVLDGGNGSDVLLGGRTDDDTDASALRHILEAWGSNERYLTRVDLLVNSLLKVGDNVFDDDARDELQGGSQRDTFFADLDRTDGDDDEVKDRERNETLTPL